MWGKQCPSPFSRQPDETVTLSAVWSSEFKTYKSILFVSTRHERHAGSLTSQPHTHIRDADGEVVEGGRNPDQIKYAKSRHPFYFFLQIVISPSVE